MNYHIAKNDKSGFDTISGEELVEKIKAGEIGEDTLVWHKGMPQWVACSSLEECKDAFEWRQKELEDEVPPPLDEVPPPLEDDAPEPPPLNDTPEPPRIPAAEPVACPASLHPKTSAPSLRKQQPSAPVKKKVLRGPLQAKAAEHPVAVNPPRVENPESPDNTDAVPRTWNPVNALVHLCQNYTNFNGRASRAEYWYSVLVVSLLGMGLWCIPYIGVILAWLVFPPVMVLPFLALSVRRLHDIGKPGSAVLFLCIPVANWVFFFLWFLKKGEGANSYGDTACEPPAVNLPAPLEPVVGRAPLNVIVSLVLMSVAACFCIHSMLMLNIGGFQPGSDRDPLTILAKDERNFEKSQAEEAEKLLLQRYGIVSPLAIQTLMEVASEGNVEMLELLKQAGADLSLHSPKGESALSLAIKNNKADNVRFLLENGAKVNDNGPDGMPVVWNAMDCKGTEILEILLNAGVSPDSEDEGRTLLQVAVVKGDTGKVKLLLDKGADPTRVIEKKGMRVPLLVMAAQNKAYDIISLLLEHKVDMYEAMEEDAVPDRHATALLCVIMNNDDKGLHVLMKHGYDIDRPIRVGRFDAAPIIIAIQNGMLDMVNELVRAEADTTQKSEDGKTILQLADAVTNEQGAQAFFALVGAAASNAQERMVVNALQGGTGQMRIQGDLNMTALRTLYKKQMLAKGIDLDQEKREKEQREKEQRERESRNAASVDNSGYSNGDSYQSGSGDDTSGGSDVAEDAELNAIINRIAYMSASGDRALYKKRLMMLLPMIQSGSHVDVTTVETKGNTALHYACGMDDEELVRWLLDHGANPNAVTNKGATPMKCAGSSSVRNMLRRYGAN